MTEEQNELIKKNKLFIEELTNVQNLYFSTLVEELNLNDRGDDFLFDYIYNNSSDKKTFEEYLKDYGRTLEEVLA